jgi:pSer/pThr/pTyr-binding forkhead associated (FHA) protein
VSEPDDGDATVRQTPAEFEATLREPREVPERSDDTNLLVSSEARLSYRDVVKQTVSQLMIVGGEPMGAIFPLSNTEYTVGRHRDNSIRLVDVGVSGQHARIYRGPDGYVIEDLKSRNGVWVNGTRVFHSVLKHGDRIQLGTTDLDYAILFGA